MMGFGMGFGLVGLLLMALLWGGLILAAVWLIRALFPQAGHPTAVSSIAKPSAHEILDGRYARGEISREEYDSMKEALSR